MILELKKKHPKVSDNFPIEKKMVLGTYGPMLMARIGRTDNVSEANNIWLGKAISVTPLLA